MCPSRQVQTALTASLYQDFSAPLQVLAKDVMNHEDRASDTFVLAVLQALRRALEAGSACSAQAAGTLLAQLNPSQRALLALRRLLQVCGRCHVVPFRPQKHWPPWSKLKQRCSSSGALPWAQLCHLYSVSGSHQQPAVCWDFMHCSLPARRLACRRRETICWTLSQRLASLMLSHSVGTPRWQDLTALVSPSVTQAGTSLWPACALLCCESAAWEAQTGALLCKRRCTLA